MTKNEFKKQFFRFLKENNVYKPFFTNFNKRHGCTRYFANISDLIDFCFNEKYLSIIDQAFCWGKTKEGDTFWNQINIKFSNNLTKTTEW